MSEVRRLLDGRRIMITGSSSGIGASAARLFAAEGAHVALMARRKERLDALVEEITAAGGQAVAVPGDVASDEDVERAVAVTVDTFGGLDAAFNNAGYAVAGSPIHETDRAVFDRIMDVNVRGVWNCLHSQIPAMLSTGRHAAVVNTSSIGGVRATGAAAAYVAAKHAVIGLTKAAALEYGEQGIRVNALVVGSTRTEMMEEVLAQAPDLETSFVEKSVQKRMADPVEVAQAAAWLCSDRSSFVTGASLSVDGGWSAI
ncbi:SDR family NAD(P)-dependent oxidoreductase [Streptomyces sp. NPDC059651]|uniref:SDR family NAD(P)-dependent oxidoreductase n=1 Tax=Streptomyces sp. NPDC059651 TaxID=3346897 RepID=UPI0036ADD147